jgi:folate-binding Fe-S cluster repair protein YgfZ
MALARCSQRRALGERSDAGPARSADGDKGCYTGQEVVARMQHLGKLKRRMFLANVPAEAKAGDPLYSEDLGDQASGMVVNAEASPDGGHDLLAAVPTASRDGSIVHLKALTGPPLNFLALPYAIT